MGAASTLIVKDVEASATGNVTDVTLMVAMYNKGHSAEKWMQVPMTNKGNGKWGTDINKELAEEGPGEYVLEIYFKAKDGNNELLLNNGGQNYKIMYLIGEGGGGGNNVHWLTTGTAEIILNADNNFLQYKYNGDYTRDNTTMPGGVDMLAINFFSIYYDLEEDTEIVDASLQYKIYADGEEPGGWSRIDCNELNTLVSSRHNTHRSTFNEQRLISRDLQPGNYTLQIMYQLIDQNGKYHFFGKENENGNFVFYFSINEPKDPDILGISMVVTPTPGEQQYPWAEKGEPFEDIDLTNEEPLESMTVDEVFIFAEGNFNYINLACKLLEMSGKELYCVSIPTQLDDFGNWSNEESIEILKTSMLESGKTYMIQYWAEGEANGDMYYLNNDGQNYKVTFIYGTSAGIKGDINGDGIVDVSDVSIAIDIVLGKADYNSAADIDNSGNVDVSDISAMIDIVLGLK